MTRFADVFRAPLGRFVLVAAAIYAAMAVATQAPFLILILNDLVMSAAADVCIAYAPVLPGALTSAHPTRGDYLGTGIFFVSFGMLLLRVISVIARDLGRPDIYNSDFVTVSLFFCLAGALHHLWAPHVKEGRIPAARWTSTGIVVAVGLFIGLGCWSLHLSVSQPPSVQLR